jgi:limonene-1,2-epoxide hydrolase
MSNEQTFRKFLDSWEQGNQAFAAVVRELFTDDCTWSQPGLPTTTGPQEAIDLANGLDAMGMTAIRVITSNSASSADGNTVFTERIDEILAADGTVMMTVPVVGVAEFRDGKVCAWREYFDSAGLAPPTE